SRSTLSFRRSLMNGNSFDFLRDVASFADNTNSVPKNKLARIDPDYDPAGFPTTLPRVIFDGEKLLTRKRYHALSPYIPEPGDRVLMIPVSTSYLIAGDRKSTRLNSSHVKISYAV